MSTGTHQERYRAVPRRVEWVVSLALLALILATSSAAAQSFKSGWAEMESGTESDLLTAEAHVDMLWAFGTNGTMLSSGDGGVTWQSFDSPASSDLIASDSAFGALAVAGGDGTVLLMKEGGGAWEDVSIPAQMDVSGIALTSNGSLVAVGPAGAIWQYDGNTWQDRSIGVEHDLLSVSFLDSENGLISGNSGTILASTDGGVVWDYRDAPGQVSSKSIVSIDYFSAIRAYAITDEGHILRSSREGSVTVGFVWSLVEIESHGRSTSLGVELNSMEVLSTYKILFTGPNGYLSLSKDGGNIVSKQMLPVANDTNFNGVAMIDNFKGIAVADGGSVLWTDNSGEEEAVGFQIIDFGDFGQFVDYSKGMLMDGLVATIKIVLFGIAMGFTIGVILSMLKTSPTTLKNIAQSNRYQLAIPFVILANALSLGRLTTNIASLRAKSAEIAATRPINAPAVKLFGLAMMLAGIGALLLILGDVWALNLLGWERIYVPVGDSGAFAYILLGIALVLLGLTFLPFNGEFSAKEVSLPIIPPIAITLVFVAGGYPLSGEDSLVDLLMTGSEFVFSLTILVTLLLLASVTYFLGRPEVFTLIGKADERNLALFFAIYEGLYGIIIFWLAKISGTNIVHDLDVFLFVTATSAAYILGAKKGWLNGDKTVPCTLVVLLTLIIFFQKIVEFNLMRGIGANEESALLVLVGTASFVAAITSGRKISLNPWGVRPLNSIATLYTDFFRNTPLIVQFMFIHFGLQLGKLIQEPGLLMLEGQDDPISSFLRDGILADRAYISAIFALGLNSGAYQCETIRGAIAAIPSGQMEAGRSIGLNYMQTMKLVIMPQAIRICIPPLGNEMVNLVLNSSLAMVIGYAELTRQGKLIIAVTFQIFWTWGMVMISYFIVTWTLALILRHLENKTRIPGLGIGGA
jgi:polar amino acid transport system permease protein